MTYPANIGTGELHESKRTGIATGAVTGQLAVTLDTGPNVYAHAGAAGAKIDGIALHDAADGESFTIVTRGDVVCTSGAAITAPDEVAVDANDKIVAAVATDHVIGQALTSTTGADEDVLVELYDDGYIHP